MKRAQDDPVPLEFVRHTKQKQEFFDPRNLPAEMWTYIFSFIPQDLHAVFLLVCHAWKENVAEGYNLNTVTIFSLGYTELLKWKIRSYDGLQFDPSCAVSTALRGHLDTLEFINPYTQMAESVCEAAAIGGHLNVLQWLRKQSPPCPWNKKTCKAAARGGHMKVLQWLRKQSPPCPWNEQTCMAAAEGGNLDVLKWLRAHGCPWNKRTCQAAARGGHMEVLKWARKNGCPWDARTCAKAAGGGHLEVLKWLRDNGCPWDFRTPEAAFSNRRWDVLKWAIENGYHWRRRFHLVSEIQILRRYGREDIIALLNEHFHS
jgi:hypothetical protein